MIPYQRFYRAIGFFLLLSVPVIESQTLPQIQELMTKDEILKVLHTTPDKIPEHEIVQIEHSLYKRSTPQDFRVNFKAFDNDVDVYLNPNEGILVGEDTPVWVAEFYEGNTRYRKLKQGIMKEAIGVYQSVPGRAALVVRSNKDAELQFDGIVEDLSIKPLPPRVQQVLKQTNKRKRGLTEGSRTMMTTEYHIVFKSNTGVNRTATAQENNEDISKQIDVSKSKRSNDVVFPTILATTDFDVTETSKNDSAYYDQIIYQLAFWNAVDLRYRHLIYPKVRLRIAGFVIGSGRSATPYLKRNMVNGKVDSHRALEDMQTYWDQMTRNGEFSSEGFHIVTTGTNLKMFATEKSGVQSEIMLGGLANPSSLCLKHEGRFYPSGIFRDDLGFGGINIAVHELGHMLGANHDELKENGCRASDGYLMSPVISSTVNNPKWSKCSLNAIGRTLRYRSCADKPKEHYPAGNQLGKLLPGTLKTTHEQCQARGFDWACKTTPRICRILKCYYTGFYGFFATGLTCQNSPSAAEGTECASGSVCLDGECKVLHPWEFLKDDEIFPHN